MGDLGGIKEIFLILIGLLVSPISKFSYTLKVLNQLYLMDTKDPNLRTQEFNDNKQRDNSL